MNERVSKLVTLLVFICSLGLSACGGGGSSDQPTQSNRSPVSNAGVDQTITLGDAITLSGSNSNDPDGDTLTYQWSISSQPSGSSASFGSAQSVTSTFTVDTAGSYVIQLAVSDGSLSNSNTLNITISEVVGSNTAPISNAGADQSVNLGTSINLDGSGSSDPDGNTLSYQWSIDSQPANSSASFDNAQIAMPTFTADMVGTYVVSLIVNDGELTNADTLNILINASINNPPEIDSFSLVPNPAFVNTAATFSWSVSDIDSDTLVCTLDVDNDGTLDYTINDCANTSSQARTFPVVGDYTATLTIDDGKADPVVETITFSVIAPLSTSVIANGPAVAGERVLYTITVGNTTQLPIEAVSVSLEVPTELSFSPFNDVAPNSSNCGNNVCTAGEEANWSLGTLAAGESRTLTVNAIVDAATLNAVVISLPVTFSATDIHDIVIDEAFDVHNTPSADLALSASVDPVVPDQTFTYQLDFGNTSAGSLSNTELRAFLPAGVSVVSISDGGVEVVTGEVMWDEGSVSSGINIRREITVMADAVEAGETLSILAALTFDGGIALDNSSEYAISVAGSAARLSAIISATPSSVASDTVLAYSITITNDFTLPVEDINVLLRVPNEINFSPFNDATPNSSNCGNNICTAAEEANWSLGTLAAGASQIISINATVAAGLVDGNLIVTPIRVTATEMEDTINMQHVTVIDN
jgi:uncharacterized repeat protein (TIGR01451 family)